MLDSNANQDCRSAAGSGARRLEACGNLRSPPKDRREMVGESLHRSTGVLYLVT